MEGEEAIYKFEGLKKLLTQMGYQVNKAVGYKPLEIVDVDINDIRKNIDFSDDGIFVWDANSQQKLQVYLYKRNYHIDRYGKPRFHIRKCQVIQSFIDTGAFEAEYRRANTGIVNVCDMGNGYREIEISDLPLCKLCSGLAIEAYRGMTTLNFVKILEEANNMSEQDEADVDILGYTRDWVMISRAMRIKHNYTCEKCGLHISEPFDQSNIHVHHRNGNKTDNRSINLQCLCVRCHAFIDKNHQERLSTGANKIILDNFNFKYPEKEEFVEKRVPRRK